MVKERKNPYKELAKLPPKQRAKIQQDLITAKKTIVYHVKGFKNKNFNAKDIYMFNPTKHIALIQTKSAKEFLLIRDLVYLKQIGYGQLVENFKKDKTKALEGYWALSDSMKEDLEKYAEETEEETEKKEAVSEDTKKIVEKD